MPKNLMLAVLACSVFAGCDNNNSTASDRIATLEAKVQTLQATIDAMQGQAQQIADLQTRVTAAEAGLTALQFYPGHENTIVKAERVLAVLARDSNGDVTITGANLRLWSGCTTSDCNGKGNLLVGFPGLFVGCQAGPRAGLACRGDADCPTSTCGSGGAQYQAGRDCVVVGGSNSCTGSESLVVGHNNTANGQGDVVFGNYNSTSSTQAMSSVLGGERNDATASYSAILGGQFQTASNLYDHLP